MLYNNTKEMTEIKQISQGWRTHYEYKKRTKGMDGCAKAAKQNRKSLLTCQ